jgi:surface antigen
VRADDYEDQVAGYDRQLQDLQAQKQAAQAALEARRQAQANLGGLQTRQDALSSVIDKGVPADGPTKPAWLKNQLAGCTNYVVGKRDVSSFPNGSGQPGHPLNANMWDNQARQAGYDVGARPVKGSIMVFEGKNDVMSVNKTDGHVAYVENVKRVDGGYEVTISQADNSGVRGTYVNQRTSTITVKDGVSGVSFIYGKP